MQCHCENNSLTKISWFAVCTNCGWMLFQRFFSSQSTEPVTITDEIVRTFSLRFVSYILLLLLFVLLLLFLFFLSAQHSKFFKRATKTRHKIWAVKIQHCPISTTFHMWVDYDVPNWFPTSKNFYRSPFSKWPPQYRTNSTLFDFNEI